MPYIKSSKTMKSLICTLALASTLVASAMAQPSREEVYGKHRHFVGSSLFMLMNFIPEPPHFYQLNLGYRITPQDAIMAEAISWRYHAPVGIPYGPSFGDPTQNFPGVVRDIGLGLAYQRIHWKGLYTTVHATPFLQQYLTPELEKIQSGFQLFLTGRIGYQFSLWQHRLFIEPSVAFTHWPINTNLPEDFAVLENQWPNYFLFEPGLHVGFNF